MVNPTTFAARFFALGICFAFLLVGCAGFAFKYYGLEAASYDNGQLLGPTPEDDIPFKRCEPSATDRHPCVVMFAKEFQALKLDYLDTQQKLKDCQHGGKNDSETYNGSLLGNPEW
jgi:hypothetical protein